MTGVTGVVAVTVQPAIPNAPRKGVKLSVPGPTLDSMDGTIHTVSPVRAKDSRAALEASLRKFVISGPGLPEPPAGGRLLPRRHGTPRATRKRITAHPVTR